MTQKQVMGLTNRQFLKSSDKCRVLSRISEVRINPTLMKKMLLESNNFSAIVASGRYFEEEIRKGNKSFLRFLFASLDPKKNPNADSRQQISIIFRQFAQEGMAEVIPALKKGLYDPAKEIQRQCFEGLRAFAREGNEDASNAISKFIRKN
jgi:hypothetical protein